MDISMIVMWLGFFLAAYSVVGNDVIQTLGTFLASNEKTMKWWVLWLFAGSILTFALVSGYMDHNIAYGRLDKYREGLQTLDYEWYYLLPPLVLMAITRSGVPVSTTFMVLTLFSLSSVPNDLPSMMSSVFDTGTKLGGMIQKSIMGYVIAFSSATVIYVAITRLTEKRFIDNPIKANWGKFWAGAQWFTTGFLWYQWLTQDLANIYVYHRGGFDLPLGSFIATLVIFLGLLAYIFYVRGGAVQEVVRQKTNTADIRAATFIDLIYGVILYIFKYNYLGLFEGKLPMSTTWVFLGLLAGREIGMYLNMEGKITSRISKMIFADLGKVFFGLLVSVVLVFVIKLLAG